jgi:hypothetical protein
MKARGVFKFATVCMASKAEKMTMTKKAIQDQLEVITGSKIRGDHRVFIALTKTDGLMIQDGDNFILNVEPLTTPQKEKLGAFCAQAQKAFN